MHEIFDAIALGFLLVLLSNQGREVLLGGFQCKLKNRWQATYAFLPKQSLEIKRRLRYHVPEHWYLQMHLEKNALE